MKLILIRKGFYVNADTILSVEIDEAAKKISIATTASYHDLNEEDSIIFAKDYLGITF